MSAAKPAGDRLKDYVPVAERIGEFYELYGNGRILTAIVEHDAERGFILMRAEVYRQPDDALPAATGHAYEVRSEGVVNKTSYIENCETGCVGRALQNLGLETKRSGQQRPSLQPAPRAASESLATDAQKKTIGELWVRLRDAGELADEAAWQADILAETNKKSRNDLTQGEANIYIASLQKLLKAAGQKADKSADRDSAR